MWRSSRKIDVVYDVLNGEGPEMNGRAVISAGINSYSSLQT